MLDISIVIPAYNEEKVIGKAVDRVASYFSKQNKQFEIIVVDDGSTDRTGEIVRQKMSTYGKARLLTNETNRGKGYSVKRGALAAAGEWILFLDADLSTQPEEFEKLKPAMQNNDIVISSRVLRDSVIAAHQPFLREWAGRFFNKVVQWYLGLPLSDTQCGFKCFNRRTKILFEKQTLAGWAFDVELLFLAQKMGFRIAEAPVVWTNDPTSTVRPRDVLAVLRDLRQIKKCWSDYRIS